MKTFKLSLILLLLLGALSCKKTDDSSNSTASTTVTTDQAADLAASSLAGNSYGLTTVSDNISANAQTLSSTSINTPSVNSLGTTSVHQECGTTLSDSTSNSGTNGSASFSYFFKFARTLNCNTSSQPDNLANNVLYRGNFSGPNITTADTGTAVFTIAGLTTAAKAFVINGEYKRSGSFQSNVGNKASGHSNVDIVLTNLTLVKPTRAISSGSATISITGSTSKNGNFSFTGTLVFNNDGTATLTINGVVYSINLTTGVRLRH
jgi:hypothetical protein